MKKYLLLLSHNAIVRRLTLIQSIAYFGAWFSNVAIYTLLIELNVDASIIALVAALYFLPGVIQAPFTGVLIDAFHPKILMLIMLLIEIIATLLLLLVTDIAWIGLLFLLIVVRMGAASFYFTLEMSLLPKVCSKEELEIANALHSMIWSISYTLGMALSGLFVLYFGVPCSFILDGVLYAIALYLLWNITEIPYKAKARSGMLKEFFDGIRYLRSEPRLLALLLLHASLGFTAFDALVALLAKIHFQMIIAVPLAIGMIHAVRAFALILGPLFLTGRIGRDNLAYLFIFQGLMILGWSYNVENFYFSLIASFFVGLATTTLWAYTYTLIQNYCHKDYYGRVIAYNDMLFLGTSGLVSLGIGYLFENGYSLNIITFIMGSAFIVTAFYFIWIKRRFLDV